MADQPQQTLEQKLNLSIQTALIGIRSTLDQLAKLGNLSATTQKQFLKLQSTFNSVSKSFNIVDVGSKKNIISMDKLGKITLVSQKIFNKLQSDFQHISKSLESVGQGTKKLSVSMQSGQKSVKAFYEAGRAFGSVFRKSFELVGIGGVAVAGIIKHIGDTMLEFQQSSINAVSSLEDLQNAYFDINRGSGQATTSVQDFTSVLIDFQKRGLGEAAIAGGKEFQKGLLGIQSALTSILGKGEAAKTISSFADSFGDQFTALTDSISGELGGLVLRLNTAQLSNSKNEIIKITEEITEKLDSFYPRVKNPEALLNIRNVFVEIGKEAKNISDPLIAATVSWRRAKAIIGTTLENLQVNFIKVFGTDISRALDSFSNHLNSIFGKGLEDGLELITSIKIQFDAWGREGGANSGVERVIQSINSSLIGVKNTLSDISKFITPLANLISSVFGFAAKGISSVFSRAVTLTNEFNNWGNLNVFGKLILGAKTLGTAIYSLSSAALSLVPVMLLISPIKTISGIWSLGKGVINLTKYLFGLKTAAIGANIALNSTGISVQTTRKIAGVASSSLLPAGAAVGGHLLGETISRQSGVKAGSDTEVNIKTATAGAATFATALIKFGPIIAAIEAGIAVIGSAWISTNAELNKNNILLDENAKKTTKLKELANQKIKTAILPLEITKAKKTDLESQLSELNDKRLKEQNSWSSIIWSTVFNVDTSPFDEKINEVRSKIEALNKDININLRFETPEIDKQLEPLIKKQQETRKQLAEGSGSSKEELVVLTERINKLEIIKKLRIEELSYTEQISVLKEKAKTIPSQQTDQIQKILDKENELQDKLKDIAQQKNIASIEIDDISAIKVLDNFKQQIKEITEKPIQVKLGTEDFSKIKKIQEDWESAKSSLEKTNIGNTAKKTIEELDYSVKNLNKDAKDGLAGWSELDNQIKHLRTNAAIISGLSSSMDRLGSIIEVLGPISKSLGISLTDTMKSFATIGIEKSFNLITESANTARDAVEMINKAKTPGAFDAAMTKFSDAIENAEKASQGLVKALKSGVAPLEKQLQLTGMIKEARQLDLDISQQLYGTPALAVQAQLSLVQTIQQQKELQEKQLAYYETVYNTLKSQGATEQELLPILQLELETRNKIKASTRDQLSAVKELRDGYLDAVQAQALGAGRFSKIIITQEQNLMRGLQAGAVKRNFLLGQYGEDAAKSKAEAYRFSAQGTGILETIGGTPMSQEDIAKSIADRISNIADPLAAAAARQTADMYMNTINGANNNTSQLISSIMSSAGITANAMDTQGNNIVDAISALGTERMPLAAAGLALKGTPAGETVIGSSVDRMMRNLPLPPKETGVGGLPIGFKEYIEDAKKSGVAQASIIAMTESMTESMSKQNKIAESTSNKLDKLDIGSANTFFRDAISHIDAIVQAINESRPKVETITKETAVTTTATTKTVSNFYKPISLRDDSLDDLKRRDKDVRKHEAAHKQVAGKYAKGQPEYEFRKGPDGKSYAVGGQVLVDITPIPGNPLATIQKMQQIQKAALAPKNPSEQDYNVASTAASIEQKARKQIHGQIGMTTSVEIPMLSTSTKPYFLKSKPVLNYKTNSALSDINTSKKKKEIEFNVPKNIEQYDIVDEIQEVITNITSKVIHPIIDKFKQDLDKLSSVVVKNEDNVGDLKEVDEIGESLKRQADTIRSVFGDLGTREIDQALQSFSKTISKKATQQIELYEEQINQLKEKQLNIKIPDIQLFIDKEITQLQSKISDLKLDFGIKPVPTKQPAVEPLDTQFDKALDRLLSVLKVDNKTKTPTSNPRLKGIPVLQAVDTKNLASPINEEAIKKAFGKVGSDITKSIEKIGKLQSQINVKSTQIDSSFSEQFGKGPTDLSKIMIGGKEVSNQFEIPVGKNELVKQPKRPYQKGPNKAWQDILILRKEEDEEKERFIKLINTGTQPKVEVTKPIKSKKPVVTPEYTPLFDPTGKRIHNIEPTIEPKPIKTPIAKEPYIPPRDLVKTIPFPQKSFDMEEYQKPIRLQNPEYGTGKMLQKPIVLPDILGNLMGPPEKLQQKTINEEQNRIGQLQYLSSVTEPESLFPDVSMNLMKQQQPTSLSSPATSVSPTKTYSQGVTGSSQSKGRQVRQMLEQAGKLMEEMGAETDRLNTEQGNITSYAGNRLFNVQPMSP